MTLLVYTDCSVLPINRSATVSPLSQRWIGSGSILTDICFRLWLLFCNHTHYKQLHSYFVVPTINMLLYYIYSSCHVLLWEKALRDALKQTK